MNEADRARDLSMAVDAIKDSMKQVQSGNIKVTFTFAPGDLPSEILEAAPGTHYKMALVEVAADGTPQKAGTATANRQVHLTYEHGTPDWAIQVSHAMANDSDCWEAISVWWPNPVEHGRTQPPANHDAAMYMIRESCGVTSTKEFRTDPEALEKFKALHKHVMEQTGRWAEQH